VTRGQALQAAKADAPPPRKPLTLLGLLWRLGSVAAVVVLAIAVYLVYFQRVPPRPLPTAPATTAPSPTPPPVASTPPVVTMPPWTAPVYDPPPPPATMPHEPEPPPETQPAAPEGPSDMDRLRERTEFWRGRFQSVNERMAQIEKDIAEMEADATRYRDVPADSAQARAKEFARDRLDLARKALDDARRELREIEDAARRDGVSPGQLY
jgi:hypothetical protein